MHLILDPLIACLKRGEPAVIGAVIKSAGSAPRKSGARIMVRNDGTFIGTIGGGALEGASLAAAKALFAAPEDHRILDFELNASDAARMGMACGGRQQVLLQRLDPRPKTLSLLQYLAARYIQRHRPVVLTLMGNGAGPQMQRLGPDTDLPETLRTTLAQKSSRSDRPFLLEEGDLRIFAEPLVYPKTVHLVGAGHVAQATARFAGLIGLDVRVMDDRAEFANQTLFPNARIVQVLADFSDCLGDLGPDDMVVIVTRGHLHDKEVLRQALRTRAGYIGMIGSRGKRDAVYAALVKEGFTNEALKRVHSPIGLKLGGDSPEEIGLSIVAQLQQVRTNTHTRAAINA